MAMRRNLAALLATAAFMIATPALAEPNTAQVCAETAKVMADIERQMDDMEAMTWTGLEHGPGMGWSDGGFHVGDPADNTDWVNELRIAIKDGKIVRDFGEIRKGLHMSRTAAAQGLAAEPRTDGDKMAWQKSMLARFKRLSAEASKLTRDEMDQRFDRLFEQRELRQRRMYDLNCDALPTTATASSNGALPLAKSERLQQDRRHDYNAVVYDQYKFTDTSAEMIIQGDPPDRRQVKWTFAGIPGSLNPGDEVAITITGTFNLQPPGSEKGANYSAGVSAEGLTQISAQNAYAYQGQFSDGLFKYKVPDHAKKVVIEIGADGGMGHFQRYCYGACAP